MTLRPGILVTLTIAVCVALFVIGRTRLTSAAESASNELDNLRFVAADARELRTLRANAPTVVTAAKPNEDLLGRVNRAMAEVGVSSRTFGSLADEGTTSLGRDTRAARLSYRLSLNGVALPDLGGFLEIWHRDHALWTPTQIDLQAASRQPGFYDVRIQLSTLYAEPIP